MSALPGEHAARSRWPVRAAVVAVARSAVARPRQVWSIARHAAGLRLAVPVASLEWLATHLLAGRRAPTDVRVTARPPALGLAATVRFKGLRMLVSCALSVQEAHVAVDELRLTVRVRDLTVDVPDEPDHALAKMLRAGGAALLGRPASLLGLFGWRPRALVSAEGDTFVLDLLQIPRLRDHAPLRAALQALSPVVGLRAIETRDDLLLFELLATPAGLPVTLRALRALMPLR